MRQPVVSVIIPTYNRPSQLAQCLTGLSQLTYPRHRFEVIVVDDGSPVDLTPVMARFRDALDLTLLRQPRGGPGAARNAGAAVARGCILAFLDDDCRPAKDWLLRLTTYFGLDTDRRPERLPNRLVGGPILNALPHNPFSTASQLLIDYFYTRFSRTENASFLSSSSFALSREGFHAVGGFHPQLSRASEDRYFCNRWRCHGHRITYVPELIVYHAHQLSLLSFLRQHFNYGRGAYHYRRLQAWQAHTTLRLERLSFYGNLLVYPLRRERLGYAFVLCCLLGLAEAATGMGFVWQWMTDSDKPHHLASDL
jgi:glycosyltransferase involved in cell wall biosynthesis